MKEISLALFTLAILLLLVVAPASDTSAQSPARIIQWSKTVIVSKDPKATEHLQLLRQIDGVEIEDIVVAGKTQIVGEEFTADDDWLRTLTIRVRNISGQKLSRIQLTVHLLEMSNESPDVPFCYGCTTAEREKGIMPGQVVELEMLGGEFYDWLRSRIEEKGGLSRIRTAELHHMYVTLPNGQTWFSGCVKTTNPRNACPQSTPGL